MIVNALHKLYEMVTGSQQNNQWQFYATSNEIVELDAWSENEIFELGCESNKTSIGFQIESERNSVLRKYWLENL